MSYVLAGPEMIAAAATDVAAISSTVRAAHMAAAAPTVAVIPAAADEVSTSIAQLFSGVAQDFQALAGQAATSGEQFAQHLNVGAGSYAAAEAVNAASMLPDMSTLSALPGQLLNDITSPFTELEDLLNIFMSEFELAFYVVYELLVFSYLTLGILIEIEELGLKALGITVPIP